MLEPGKFYHIYNRGNNKENLFKEDKNYFYFRDLWQRHLAPVTDTYAYCLLPNHFHYFVRIKEDISHVSPDNDCSVFITQQFSNFFNAYTKAINKAYTRTGSLFQERFKRKEITDAFYCQTLMCYIHTNAQKHGLATDFKSYPYSSYHSIIEKWDVLTNKDFLREWFGNKDEYAKLHNNYVLDSNWNIGIFEKATDDD